MKVTRRKLLNFGIVVVAVVTVAVLLNRENDRLTVHLVDKKTGEPFAAEVEVEEYREYPWSLSLRFLPDWLRTSKRIYSRNAGYGTFKIRELKAVRDRAFLFIKTDDENRNRRWSLIYGDTSSALPGAKRIGPKTTEVWIEME